VLVYHRDSLGYTVVGSKRVYGEFFNYGRFGPTEVSYKEFRENKENLIELPITGEWLSKKFNKKFPQCSFKYSEMRKLDFNKLIEIAILLDIKYLKPRSPTTDDIRALKNVVIRKIEQSI